jgi:gamma-glutamylcyclotransferase
MRTEDRPMDTWYFAYGSNLDPDRKERRTGPIRDARRARLPSHRFAFNKRSSDGTGKANVIPDVHSEVWGVVYRCSPEAMNELDLCEGSPKHYTSEPVIVFLDSGEKVDAVAYVARSERVQEGLRPTADYLQHILDGAHHHQLPLEHIKAIEQLA